MPATPPITPPALARPTGEPAATPPAVRRIQSTAGVGAKPRGNSVSAAVYRDLRADIVSLRRKPGDALSEKLIAQDYGISRTPVREAVLRLADEGLIEIFPQSGTFVSRIPVAALPEAIAIRKALEQATVRYAAQRATRSQVAALNANIELQRETDAAGDLDGFYTADESFHALLAEASGFPGFWTVIQQTKVQIDRYRRLTLPVRGRMALVISEHVAIVDAVAAHDADAAVTALDSHLDDLEVTISPSRKANPYYFTGPG